MEAYFYNFRNVNDLKTEYRRLSKIHHPDKGGDLILMKEINCQYELAKKNINDYRCDYFEIYQLNIDIELLKIKAKIVYNNCKSDIIESKCNVTFEIIKDTIFVYGNTFLLKDELKKNKFRWFPDFKCWTYNENRNFKSYLNSLDSYRDLNKGRVIKLIQK